MFNHTAEAAWKAEDRQILFSLILISITFPLLKPKLRQEFGLQLGSPACQSCTVNALQQCRVIHLQKYVSVQRDNWSLYTNLIGIAVVVCKHLACDSFFSHMSSRRSLSDAFFTSVFGLFWHCDPKVCALVQNQITVFHFSHWGLSSGTVAHMSV